MHLKLTDNFKLLMWWINFVQWWQLQDHTGSLCVGWLFISGVVLLKDLEGIAIALLYWCLFVTFARCIDDQIPSIQVTEWALKEFNVSSVKIFRVRHVLFRPPDGILCFALDLLMAHERYEALLWVAYLVTSLIWLAWLRFLVLERITFL